MLIRTALRIFVLSAVIAAVVAGAPQGTAVVNKPAAKPQAKKARIPVKPGAKSNPPKAPSQGPPKKKNASHPPAVRRISQQHPTPERYQEIQQALADKGYFSGARDGNWGQDSVDALKRFQHDQNLTEDGKIGSLSLIALGLGPKHDASPIASAPGPDRAPEKTDP